MSKTSIGARLRELRLERKMPLRKVAAMLDIDVAVLSKMERGQRKLTRDMVLKLAGIYNINSDLLLIHFLSERVLYTIDGEPLADQVLKAAESSIEYVTRKQIEEGKNANIERFYKKFREYLSLQNLVSKAWIFGSFARGTATVDSDVDIAIEVPSETIFTFFDLADIKEAFQHISGKKVDVVLLQDIRPAIKQRIENEMILIYEV